MKKGFIPLVFLLFSTACATMKGGIDRVVYQPTLEDDEARQNQALLWEKKLKDSIEADVKPKNVPIYTNEIPEGLSYKTVQYSVDAFGYRTESIEINVKPGYKHKILSRLFVHQSYKFLINRWMPFDGINFHYTDDWRKALCYPQIPFYVLTLSTWGILPTWYPCVGEEVYFKTQAIKDLKRAVQVAGGDFAVGHIRYFETESVEDIGKERRVSSVNVLIFQVDPRFKNGKMNTTPIKKSNQQNEKRDESKDL